MTKFHVNSNGKADACTATLKACPLGGEHFDSKQEAALAAMEASLNPGPRPDVLDGLTQKQKNRYRAVEDFTLAELVEMRDDHEANQEVVEQLIAQRKTTATPMGDFGSYDPSELPTSDGLLITDADYADALASREDLDEKGLQRYLQASGHVFVVQAVRAKLQEKDGYGWSDYANPHELTVEDRHHIALREVMVDADRWLDETDDRLHIATPGHQEAWERSKRDDAEAERLHLAQLNQDRDPRHRYGFGGQPKEVTERLNKIAQLEAASASAQRGMRMADSKKEFAELSTKKGDIDRQLGHLRLQQIGHEAASNGGKGIDPNFIEALKNMYLGKFGRRPEDDGVDTGTLIAMFNKGELA